MKKNSIYIIDKTYYSKSLNAILTYIKIIAFPTRYIISPIVIMMILVGVIHDSDFKKL